MKTNTNAAPKLIHVLKDKTYEFKTPTTRARAIRSEGLVRVTKPKIKVDTSAARFTYNLASGLRVPMASLIAPLVRDILTVRARH